MPITPSDFTQEQARDFCYDYGVDCYDVSGEHIQRLDYKNAWERSEEAETGLTEALEHSPDDMPVLKKLIDVYHRQMFITGVQGDFIENWNICFRKLKPIDDRLKELKSIK